MISLTSLRGTPPLGEMWIALILAYASTAATRLRALTLKFDTNKMAPNVTMEEHLRKMSAMIRDLKAAGNMLTNEQQILAVLLCSLPNSWEKMKLTMTCNESIKTFAQLSHHLKLEAERQFMSKHDVAFLAEPSKAKGKRPQHNRKGHNSQRNLQEGEAYGPSGSKCKQGKRGGKKDKSKAKCYNCGNLSHFARECSEPKKVMDSRAT